MTTWAPLALNCMRREPPLCSFQPVLSSGIALVICSLLNYCQCLVSFPRVYYVLIIRWSAILRTVPRYDALSCTLFSTKQFLSKYFYMEDNLVSCLRGLATHYQPNRVLRGDFIQLHCVSKNDIDVEHYSFGADQPVLVVFGGDVDDSTLSNGDLLSYLS